MTLPNQRKNEKRYEGIAVTVMGLGSFGGGVAASRFLAEQGAIVTVTDVKTREQLSDSLEMLSAVAIHQFVLGGHTRDAFSQCQLLVANPAVKPDNAFVRSVRDRGIEVTTEIELFLKHNPAPVIAVTGSNGKSTTSALIHHLLTTCRAGGASAGGASAGGVSAGEASAGEVSEARKGKVWLGGNIGISLLDRLPEIGADDLVVLELSSFQLEALRRNRFRPQIAVLTNFSPNHLDWHGSEAAYRAAKQSLFDAQLPDDVSIIPNDEVRGIPWRTRAPRLQFGLTDNGEDGAFLEGGSLVLRSARGKFEDTIRLNVPPQLPGIHNRLNIAAAACAAWQAGADSEGFSEALKTFRPLPHRLQLVAERFGRRFWNDSIATTQESAIMALQVFPERVILLAGGYDKGQDLGKFASEIRSHAKAVVLMGQTAEALDMLLHDIEPDPGSELKVCHANDFANAFQQAVDLSEQGDVVLLSPGCASYGWFRDFRERGDLFTELAREWRPVE